MWRYVLILLVVGLVLGEVFLPDVVGGSTSRRISLFYTLDTYGEIEPCGCPSSPLGGLAQRGAMLARLRAEGVPMALFDAGNTLLRGEPTSLRDRDLDGLRLNLLLDVMASQGVQALAVGPNDLWVLPPAELKKALAGRPFPALSINLREGDKPLFMASTVVMVGSARVGVIGITDPERELPPGLVALDPAPLVAAEARRLRPGVDLVIALSNTSEGQNEGVLKVAPDLDVILSGVGDRQVRNPSGIYDEDGRPPFLVGVAGMGRYVGRLDVYLGDSPGARPIASPALAQSLKKEAVARQQLATLAREIEAEEGKPRPDRVAVEGAFLIKQIDDTSKSRGKDPLHHELAFSSLAIFPSEGSDLPTRQRVETFKKQSAAQLALREKRVVPLVSFVGTQSCRGCHPIQSANWLGTAHARAWRSLEEIGRHQDPECIGCHSTGFNMNGGFYKVEDAPRHKNVGCESCHGPLSDHPNPRRIPAETTRATCETCHDKVNSPAFDYPQYKRRITCPASVTTPAGIVGDVK